MNRGLQQYSRRDFVRVAAASAGALATGSLFLSACEPEAATTLAPGTAVGGPLMALVGRNALRIPPTVAPSGLVLTAQPDVADVGGGQIAGVWAYNGSFPAPTIRARTGDTATMQLQNGLGDPTTIHWHGMIVPWLMDGHPLNATQPGGSYAFQYPIVQRATMNWYHPHPHGLTGEQVCMGLAGAFIIEDDEEAALGLPSGAYEVPLIIRDADFDSQGNLKYTAKSSGFLGRVPLVNGVRDAGLEVDTTLYRLRILNGANARVFHLVLNNGAPFTLIGNDGGLLEAPVQVTQIDMSPAERVDVLVDFSGMQVGESVMLRSLGGGSNTFDLVEFVVARQVTGGGTVPSTLSTIPKLSPADVVTTRDFSFDGMTRINGQVYDLNRIDFQVPLGQTERWRFITGGNAPHPVHVHGEYFQVQSRTGGRGALFPWEAGWKDTVLLEDGETVEVLIRFDHHTGTYLMHCHKLEHEDMGMMLNFQVV